MRISRGMLVIIELIGMIIKGIIYVVEKYRMVRNKNGDQNTDQNNPDHSDYDRKNK